MQTQAPKFSARHYTSLDGLRGLAFLLVFVHHYALTSHSTQPWILALAWLADGGWMGVDLFFVLSGFLITGILLDTRGGRNYYINFYARRSLRILPLYYGILFLLLALTPLWHLQWRLGHIGYFLYMGNIAGHVDNSLNTVKPFVNLTHTWSLAVEEQFYLLWPLLVAWAASSRRLLKLCFGLAGIGLLLRVLLLLTQSLGHAAEWSYGELPTHADGLLMGAVAAILVRHYPLTVLVRRTLLPIVASGLVLGLLAIHGRSLDYHAAWMTVVVYPALAVFFSCTLIRALHPGTVMHAIGKLGMLRFFGRYSYGMYLYHQILSPLTGRLLPVLQAKLHSTTLGGLAYFFLIFASTIVVSVISYELYEKQWLRLKSRFAFARDTMDVAAAS